MFFIFIFINIIIKTCFVFCSFSINEKEFNKIINKKILNIKRRSKYILIELNGINSILVHLGMTGKFFIIDKNNAKYKTSFYYNIH